jgi:acyl carrier protein
MCPDGCLVHIGRSDFQINIRGYSIEPAEIEMVILDLPNIKEAVVLSVKDRSANQRLVAYIVLSGRSTPTVSELRYALAQKLPGYMIPSAFVFLDALPLIASGKVNYRALPPPSSERPQIGTPFVEPQSPVEMELAEIWSDVLGLDEVGINDSFFDLGGHSLLAIQVISQVIKKFRVEVPLKSLFQSPTVADMAIIIVQNLAEKAEREIIEHILAKLDGLSEEQVQRLLADDETGSDFESGIS